MVKLGDLNETVVILRSSVTGQSATGEDLLSWSTVDHWPVCVEELAGSERLGVSDAPTSVIQYRVTGRNRDDLQPGMRLRRGADILEIAVAPPMPRSMWSVVKCFEVDRGAS
ncbi:MAG TPA: head-tail adaptor protein [Vicinamibacterales bacterium]|nr:head-tail adaptor protein [Vicinamibacterales bacterium]